MTGLHRCALLLASFVLLFAFTGTFASEADGSAQAPANGSGSGGPRHGGAGRGGNRLQFILKHAEDLGLSDEQKTSLEALAKDSGATVTPESIAALKEKADAVLTDAQRDKIKELFSSRQAERTDPGVPPPPPAPVATPHIEDNFKSVELLQFIQNHKSELFIRNDQGELLEPLTSAAAKDAGTDGVDADRKKKLFGILTGQQIGKLREMLKAQAHAATTAPAQK